MNIGSSPKNKPFPKSYNISREYEHPLPFGNSTSANVNKIILTLQDENSKLSYKLGKIESICEEQSYRLGNMKGELTETKKKLED